jgi:hypothetical protein
MNFIVGVLCVPEYVRWHSSITAHEACILGTPKTSEFQFSPADKRTLCYRILQVPTFSTFENISRHMTVRLSALAISLRVLFFNAHKESKSFSYTLKFRIQHKE